LAMLFGALIWALLSKLFGKKHQGDLTIEGEGALRAEADGLRARVQELEGSVSARDGEVSDLKGKLAAAAAGAAAATAVATTAKPEADDDSYALEWRNRYLAARVKYLEGRLADTPAPVAAKPKKKAPVKKKAPAKKKAAPKAKAAPKPKVLYKDGPTDGKPDDLKEIKGIGPKFEKDLNGKGIYYFRPGPKPGTKRGALTKDGRTRQKPGPKSGSSRKPAVSAAQKKFDKYYANVQKFDKGANADVVRSIIKYCGPALNTRDASLVACSDEAEVSRVAKGFITKKLGLKSGQLDLAKDVCTQMKPVRFKDRVTFYYLAAKKAGKLSVFK